MNEKVIAVIDLKAFYAFTECVDRGLDPWKTPLVVADKERGTNTIVLSVSPFLKAKGIPSRCRIKELPKGIDYIYAVPRMERYIEKSKDVLDVFLDFFSDEDIHVYSIDESFIDLTSYLDYYHKKPLEIVQMVINAVKEKTGLQATAGIGDNFFLAKVALDVYAKKEKNGIATITIKDVRKKIWPIYPLSKVWGIGSRLEARLNKLGIFTMQDLANSSLEYLKSKFGVIGEELYNHANGIDEADIREEYVPKSKSLSQAQVLFRDFTKEEAKTIVREMCDDLAERMRGESLVTSLVSIFIGYSKNLGGFAKQMSLLSSTDNQDILSDALLTLYNNGVADLPIRNVGICFGKLKEKGHQQLNIFEDSESQIKADDLQKTIDNIHKKYGKNKLVRLSALTDSSTIIERHNQIGGHRR